MDPVTEASLNMNKTCWTAVSWLRPFVLKYVSGWSRPQLPARAMGKKRSRSSSSSSDSSSSEDKKKKDKKKKDKKDKKKKKEKKKKEKKEKKEKKDTPALLKMLKELFIMFPINKASIGMGNL